MLTFSDDDLRRKVRKEMHVNADNFAFLPFKNLEESIMDDIQILKESKLVKQVPITGYLYEVESGRIVKMADSD